MRPASGTAPAAHEAAPAYLAQLEAIDQRYWWHRVRWRIVRACVRGFGRRRSYPVYFDVGSGGGGLPALLVDDFAFERIVLFDERPVPSSKIVHRNVTQQVVDLERFDGAGLPAPDLVTCLDVLEHLQQPAPLLRELRRLSEGRQSLLIVTVPAHRWLWSFWDEAIGHRRRYTRTQLCGLLEEAGWSVRFCRYFFQAAVPAVWCRRHMNRRSLSGAFPLLPEWLNRTLEVLCWSEFRLLHRWPVPFGVSLVAVAEPSGGGAA